MDDATHVDADVAAAEVETAEMDAREDAIDTLAHLADRLNGLKRGISLSVHSISRKEFDGLDGQEAHWPPTDDRHEYWSKDITLFDGHGKITVTLFTTEPPSDLGAELRQAIDEFYTDGGVALGGVGRLINQVDAVADRLSRGHSVKVNDEPGPRRSVR